MDLRPHYAQGCCHAIITSVGNRQPPPFLKLSIQQILISNFLFGDCSLKVFDNFQKSIHFKVPVKTLPCIRCVRAHIRRFFGIGLIK